MQRWCASKRIAQQSKAKRPDLHNMQHFAAFGIFLSSFMTSTLKFNPGRIALVIKHLLSACNFLIDMNYL